MRRNKDLFIVHTNTSDIHRRLHKAVSGKLKAAGVSVWQYQDWDWRLTRVVKDDLFSDESAKLLSDVDKALYHYRYPRRVPGQVDRQSLRGIVIGTPAVLILDLPETKMTPGLKEESQIIDKEIARLLPLGHFGLVRFGTDGYFARRYPMHCGAVLDLEDDVEISDRMPDQIALFALRILMRNDMLTRTWQAVPSDPVQAIGQWLAKSKKLIACCEFTIEPDRGIIELVQEVLTWSVCLARRIGEAAVWHNVPDLAAWVNDCFDRACRFSHLDEEGLVNLVSILRGAGSTGTELLRDILYYPMYRESSDVEMLSWKAIVESSRGIAVAQGRAATEPLVEALTSPELLDEMRNALLEGLGRVAEESAPSERRRAAAFMQDLVDGGSLDNRDVGACVRAFGRVAEPSDIPWLRSFLSEPWPDTVRLNALLALMQLIGPEACQMALSFVKRAGPRARRTIGSASWRVDDDRLYDALLQANRSDEKMVGIVLYSLTKAGSPRAFAQALACLSSESAYFHQLAVIFFPEIKRRCCLTDIEIQQFVDRAARFADAPSELTRFGAILSLVSCGQGKYASPANELLRHCLSKGDRKEARALLIAGGLGLQDWPRIQDLRLMLFHPSSAIRGAAAFLAGAQRRDLSTELQILQYDPSDVPTFLSDNAMKDIGRTVEESATLALQRLVGAAPLPNLLSW